MKEIIAVIVGEDHSFQCDTRRIARTGENDVEQFEITLADGLCDSWAYLDFEKANKETYKTGKLDIVDGKIVYAISAGVLDVEGELKAQLVLQKESGEIWKSDKKSFVVGKSIDAIDDIPDKDDFVAYVERELSSKVDEEWVKQYVDAEIVNGEW